MKFDTFIPVQDPSKKAHPQHEIQTQKDTNFRNTIIIRNFGLENPQNPTQKDRNFEKCTH